jgi:hypothetical protein
MARPLRRRAIDWSVNDYPGNVAEDPTSSSEPGLSSQWKLMQDRFVIVLVVVLVGAVIAAVWAAVGTAEVYRQIGRGGLSLNDGTDRPAYEPTPASAAGEREAEIRQMLEARNARRAARSQAPADVEAELAELLTAPGVAPSDPALVAEVRDLVIARNARRARAGKEPLDVEDEVARQLRELT